MATHTIDVQSLPAGTADARPARPAGALRWLPILLLTGLITAIDMAVVRWFPRLDDGFLFAWIVLWALGIVGVTLFAGAALRVSGWAAALAGGQRRRREDAELLAAAAQDHRLAAELRIIATREA